MVQRICVVENCVYCMYLRLLEETTGNFNLYVSPHKILDFITSRDMTRQFLLFYLKEQWKLCGPYGAVQTNFRHTFHNESFISMNLPELYC